MTPEAQIRQKLREAGFTSSFDGWSLPPSYKEDHPKIVRDFPFLLTRRGAYQILQTVLKSQGPKPKPPPPKLKDITFHTRKIPCNYQMCLVKFKDGNFDYAWNIEGEWTQSSTGKPLNKKDIVGWIEENKVSSKNLSLLIKSRGF